MVIYLLCSTLKVIVFLFFSLSSRQYIIYIAFCDPKVLSDIQGRFFLIAICAAVEILWLLQAISFFFFFPPVHLQLLQDFDLALSEFF